MPKSALPWNSHFKGLLTTLVSGKHVVLSHRYYLVSLVLISLSLVLQILAGLISLAIEHSLSYLSKHRTNMCEDMKESCCPWSCVRQGYSTDKHKHSTAKTKAYEITDFADDVETDPESSPLCGVCPCKCTTALYEHYEASSLRMHSKWECSSMAVQLKMIHAEESLQREVSFIEQAEKDLAQLTTKLENDSQRTQTENAIAELNGKLKQSQERKDKYKLEMDEFKIFKEQGSLLKEFTAAIKKDRVMRMATFWQYVLNYIFYLIFAMNAFITGFGLASSPPTQPQALNASNAQEQ